METILPKTALLSAFNKDGVEDFARRLKEMGWNLLASAGTAKFLAERGIPARNIAEIVGPPILGHRVVTLSRELHAGLLAQDTAEDRAELERIGAPFIDLVYVDLYPLQKEIANPGRTLQSVIEKTDIGGPTMLRSAAKGRRLVVSNPSQFPAIFQFLRAGGVEECPPAVLESFISALVWAAEDLVADYVKASALFHREICGGRSAAEVLRDWSL